MVWLSSRNIQSERPTEKLSGRWLGTFQIFEKVSTHAYQLMLPSQLKSIHQFFHISLLEPVKRSIISNKHQEPPPPIIIEEEEDWEISKMLGSKITRGKVSFKGQKDPLGKHLETSRISLNMSNMSINCILTSQAKILKELYLLYVSSWGEELPKVSPTPGIHL
ncbi:hypothetical protein O181_005888 [Austropuccinia psidii MF-1]|uniref:Tf2-1-like SH3-like domain-containing protein n=1 Tax=Austropuccinia psidii MF-1 TaxID=1389203 RepID=A0A9Q3BJ48_9BASI|nr:hypothetical protein [Austropuccinia psidii MF-1]